MAPSQKNFDPPAQPVLQSLSGSILSSLVWEGGDAHGFSCTLDLYFWTVWLLGPLLAYQLRMQDEGQAAGGARGAGGARVARARRTLPPIYFLQERGLQLLRGLWQQRENAANGRDYAVYDQRWNRKLGQIIGRRRRATNGLRRNELDEYFRGQLEAAQIAEWNEALATYDRTEAARTERRLNLLRRNGARLLRAFLDDLILGADNVRDYEEHERRVVDNILARYIFAAAHLQRLDLGRHYSRILPEAQHRQWIQLLERFDQGADADSTSGSSSSSEAGDG